VKNQQLIVISPVTLEVSHIKLRGFRQFEYVESIVVNESTQELYLTVVVLWPMDREIYVVKPKVK
jgi:hypothetical protein